jgi:hypothetical protein
VCRNAVLDGIGLSAVLLHARILYIDYSTCEVEDIYCDFLGKGGKRQPVIENLLILTDFHVIYGINYCREDIVTGPLMFSEESA